MNATFYVLITVEPSEMNEAGVWYVRGRGPWNVEGFSLMSLFLTSLTPTPEAPVRWREGPSV